MRRVKVIDLGITKYSDALVFQEDLLLKRISGRTEDTLIITEHYPVITLGRQFSEENILDPEYFKNKGIDILKTGRGGKITYHAPGQIVLYPVIDLRGKKKDVSSYIDFLEKTVTESLKQVGVQARRDNRRGIWVQNKKIAFIGIGIKQWVTYHGVSINVNNDIDPFLRINPCGESDIKVTSLKEALGHEVDIEKAKEILAKQFEKDLVREYGVETVNS